jgi:DNA-binding NarL/FixJ family response regulator
MTKEGSMVDRLRVLVYSSSAAAMAGMEATLDVHGNGAREFVVVAHTRGYRELSRHAALLDANVVVLHGLGRDDLIRWGDRAQPAVVLAVEDDCSGADIAHAVRAGIISIVSVDTDLPGLRPACGEAFVASPYLSPSLVRPLMEYLSGRDARAQTRLRLTAREVQVLRHLAAGRSQSEISELMRISNRTVKHHLGNVYHKLGARSQAEAVVLAYREGLAN